MTITAIALALVAASPPDPVPAASLPGSAQASPSEQLSGWPTTRFPTEASVGVTYDIGGPGVAWRQWVSRWVGLQAGFNAFLIPGGGSFPFTYGAQAMVAPLRGDWYSLYVLGGLGGLGGSLPIFPSAGPGGELKFGAVDIFLDVPVMLLPNSPIGNFPYPQIGLLLRY